MWFSTDGRTWARARAIDNTAQKMGPLLSATVTRMSSVYAVSMGADGVSRELVLSKDGGMTWRLVKRNDSTPYASSIDQITSLSTSDMEYLFVTVTMGEAASIYVSTDGGTNWAMAKDHKVGGPTGTALLEIGNGYQAGATKILAVGKPASGLGTWLGSLSIVP